MKKGHNMQASDAVDAYHLSKLMKAKESRESENGKYSSLLARLQAKGLDTEASKEALKIHKAGNASEKVEFLRKLANYLRILGTPLESDQAELFAAPAVRATPEEKAKENGFGCGILGMGQDNNPNGVETDLGQVWMSAWHEGCKARGRVAAEDEAEEADAPDGSDDDGLSDGVQADLEGDE